MEAITQTPETKLHEWEPEISREVRSRVAEIIAWANSGALDIARSRGVEQEVLDILDAPASQ